MKKILKLSAYLAMTLFFVWVLYQLQRFNAGHRESADLKMIINQQAEIAVNNVEKNISSQSSADRSDSSQPENEAFVNAKVPFVVQAPSGNWSDPIYQNGCEEASAIMAASWVQEKNSIEPGFAQQEIKNISEFETKKFGSYVDTDIDDTASFIREYYNINSLEVKKDISSQDMIGELEKGNILLIPMFGQALGNPHFTAPGPIEHMLVVTGFDPKTNQFITNDPGTKFGQGYRYKTDTFMNAVWMYPTSDHVIAYPGKNNSRTAMIVVSRK